MFRPFIGSSSGLLWNEVIECCVLFGILTGGYVFRPFIGSSSGLLWNQVSECCVHVGIPAGGYVFRPFIGPSSGLLCNVRRIQWLDSKEGLIMTL